MEGLRAETLENVPRTVLIEVATEFQKSIRRRLVLEIKGLRPIKIDQ
jgi:hypothetical protein